jgi:hypothetical protein
MDTSIFEFSNLSSVHQAWQAVHALYASGLASAPRGEAYIWLFAY